MRVHELETREKTRESLVPKVHTLIHIHDCLGKKATVAKRLLVCKVDPLVNTVYIVNVVNTHAHLSSSTPSEGASLLQLRVVDSESNSAYRCKIRGTALRGSKLRNVHLRFDSSAPSCIYNTHWSTSGPFACVYETSKSLRFIEMYLVLL